MSSSASLFSLRYRKVAACWLVIMLCGGLLCLTCSLSLTILRCCGNTSQYETLTLVLHVTAFDLDFKHDGAAAAAFPGAGEGLRLAVHGARCEGGRGNQHLHLWIGFLYIVYMSG